MAPSMIPTILVIEDNTLDLELVRDVLISAGMRVVEALTPQAGLRVALEISPSVILSEYIPKPIDTRTLPDRIRALLETGRHRRPAESKVS